MHTVVVSLIGVCNGRGVVRRSVKGAQERDLAAEYRSQAKQRAFEYAYVSSVLESIAAGYDRVATWWDDEAEIEKRRGVRASVTRRGAFQIWGDRKSSRQIMRGWQKHRAAPRPESVQITHQL